jgi:hypothetical protein
MHCNDCGSTTGLKLTWDAANDWHYLCEAHGYRPTMSSTGRFVLIKVGGE